MQSQKQTNKKEHKSKHLIEEKNVKKYIEKLLLKAWNHHTEIHICIVWEDVKQFLLISAHFDGLAVPIKLNFFLLRITNWLYLKLNICNEIPASKVLTIS